MRLAKGETVRLTTLVIDDDEMMLRSLQRLFGRGCLVAEETTRGIVMAAEHQPAAILVDVKLQQQISGLELLPVLRAVAPRSSIVVMSGSPSEEDKERAFEAGAAAYVDKADAARLREIVSDAVDAFNRHRRASLH